MVFYNYGGSVSTLGHKNVYIVKNKMETTY